MLLVTRKGNHSQEYRNATKVNDSSSTESHIDQPINASKAGFARLFG